MNIQEFLKDRVLLESNMTIALKHAENSLPNDVPIGAMDVDP